MEAPLGIEPYYKSYYGGSLRTTILYGTISSFLFMAYTLMLLLGSHIGALGRSLHGYFVISPFSLSSQLVMASIMESYLAV